MKLFLVPVTLDFDLPVVANDPDEAAKVAEQNWKSDLSEMDLDGCVGIPREISALAQLPKEYRDIVPFGSEDTPCEQFVQTQSEP